MTKKIVTFKLTVEVDDNGEFDSRFMRDALGDAYDRWMAEGLLTPCSDETTGVGPAVVTHESTTQA